MLTGVDHDKFIQELPDKDWLVTPMMTCVGVHASAWTQEEFAERFPEVFDDAEDGGWVGSDGQVTIDTRIRELPGEMFHFLHQCEELESEPISGSVTGFETD